MKTIFKEQEKVNVLLLLLLVLSIAITFLKPVAQDPKYHLFADSRMIASLPNFWNVLSNIPFLAAGFYGIFSVFLKAKVKINAALRINYFVFFAGIFLTGIGSSYYHLNPGNATLLWDRLPMTISFMSFSSIIIGEFISTAKARLLLLPLLITGIGSVIYWHITELRHQGDLRLYAAVQFLPMILIPLIMLLFKQVKYKPVYLWTMLVAYAISKICETFDAEIFTSLKFISGHSIKHFFAALAPFIFLFAIHRSKENPDKA